MIEHDHQRFGLPRPVALKVQAILAAYADGVTPTILAPEDDLSTQEAADILKLSRPTVVKMMDVGRLPFHKPGAHRRVRRADLMAFKDNLQRERLQALRDLSAAGQALEQDAREQGSFDDDMI